MQKDKIANRITTGLTQEKILLFSTNPILVRIQSGGKLNKMGEITVFFRYKDHFYRRTITRDIFFLSFNRHIDD